MQKAIKTCRIFTGEEIITDAVIVTENGMITALQKEVPDDAELIDLSGWNIAPGLIDIQVNGGHRFYFSQSPTVETLHDICDSSLVYGTTHTLPCLISSTKETILQAINAVKQFMQEHPHKGVIGMHLEGPFLNPEKRGAHNNDLIRKPTNKELEEIICLGTGVIKMMTIAPECFTDEQLQMLMNAGFILSAGHSNMNYESAKSCFNKGIKMVTHLFNAMPAIGHREPGLPGAALDDETVYTPIILDGAHCHYAMARMAYRLKKDKMILLSDACFLGRKVKTFDSELLNATLVDGFYRNKEGNLAGAAISMWEAVQNAVSQVGVSTAEALSMGSHRVAKALSIDAKLGKIEPGYPATFAIFTPDLLQVKGLCL